jgi:hypothetical protein
MHTPINSVQLFKGSFANIRADFATSRLFNCFNRRDNLKKYKYCGISGSPGRDYEG